MKQKFKFKKNQIVRIDTKVISPGNSIVIITNYHSFVDGDDCNWYDVLVHGESREMSFRETELTLHEIKYPEYLKI